VTTTVNSDTRLHLIALPLAVLGLAVGIMLVWLEPLASLRQRPTPAMGRSASEVKLAAAPLPVELTDEELAFARTFSPLPPPREDPTNARSQDPRAAALGQALFFEKRLSGSGALSCASCHDPRQHFADGKIVAEGIGRGERNTLTLVNAAHHRWFTWDGRSDSMWAQGLDPLEDPLEMGGNRVAIVRLVARDSAYRTAYERAFGPIPPIDSNRLGGPRIPDAAKPVPLDVDDPLHVEWTAMREIDRDRVDRVFSNVGKALAAYQRLLVDNDSPLDRFIAGLAADGKTTTAPLEANELRGLQLFVGKANCVQCHHGPTLTDGEFHNIGVPVAGGGLPTDAGRYEGVARLKRNPFGAAGAFSDAPESEVAVVSQGLVNSPEQWGSFRTPSLRGVANTAPYMHAGQFATLEDVVRFYSTLEGAVQLDHHRETLLKPLHLTEAEIADLSAFLGALTGTGPAEEFCSAPDSPLAPRSIAR